MFDSASPSEPCARPPLAVPAFVRGASEVRAELRVNGGVTGLAQLYETGSLRLRLPRAHGRCEAVLLNTGGGIAGGDRLATALTLGAGAHVVATSQAAEKIYRAEAEPATIAVRLTLGAGARLDWLPQETILHDGARVRRALEIDMAGDATLTLLEMIVFGRLARGEQVTSGEIGDRWRIRRDGRLVLAEQIRLEGPVAGRLDRGAIGNGARAIATLVHIAPSAEGRIDAVRETLTGATCHAGASAWNGMLVTRFAAADPALLRAAAARAAMTLTGAALPRSWSC